jgi:ABC-type Fe3+ transport system substrate-binding protein
MSVMTRAGLIMSAVALVIAIVSAGYISSVASSLKADTQNTFNELTSKVTDVSNKLQTLEQLVNLYAKASGIESPAQAEQLLRQRQELQAKIEGAKRESGTLRIYGSVDFRDIKSLIDAFQARYPFIRVTYEEMRPPEVYTRVTGEITAGKPTADLVIVSHTTGLRMAKEGRYLPYISPEAATYPETLKDKDGLWTAFVLLPIALVYNTKLVKPEELPKTLEDLVNPRWKGKIVMHDITLGTVGTQWLVSLKDYIGESRWNNFVRGLLDLKPTLDIAVSAVAELVAAGEYAIGIVINLHDVVRLKIEGAPIDYFLPEGVPLLTSFSHIAIIKTTQNVNSAKLFVDFALSQEGQTIIGNVPVRFPARPGTPAAFTLEKVLKPGMKIEPYPTTEAFEKARQWADEFKKMGFGTK